MVKPIQSPNPTPTTNPLITLTNQTNFPLDFYQRSGGRVFHGRLLWQCNKWLRWALIEASWSAIQFSGYFGGLYRAARDRGKNRNVAVTMVAHRLAVLLWRCLREGRPYTEAMPSQLLTTFPDRSEPQVTVAAARKAASFAS